MIEGYLRGLYNPEEKITAMRDKVKNVFNELYLSKTLNIIETKITDAEQKVKECLRSNQKEPPSVKECVEGFNRSLNLIRDKVDFLLNEQLL